MLAPSQAATSMPAATASSMRLVAEAELHISHTADAMQASASQAEAGEARPEADDCSLEAGAEAADISLRAVVEAAAGQAVAEATVAVTLAVLQGVSEDSGETPVLVCVRTFQMLSDVSD